MGILGLLSIISTCIQVVKETFSTTIPAENWENYDLYHQDMMNGMPVEERMKNVRNGKYKITETYPEPHRDPKTGKIIIENTLLYNEDVKNHGAYQAYQWMQQGKYNLSPDDLKKEEERIKKHFDYLFSL